MAGVVLTIAALFVIGLANQNAEDVDPNNTKVSYFVATPSNIAHYRYIAECKA